MAVTSVVTKIPWKQVIAMIPDVVRAAKAIWERWDAKPKPTPIDTTVSPSAQILAISTRIQALENNEATQSKLVSDIAEQLQGIAAGLEETATRQTFSIWLAAGAFAISVICLAALLMTQ